MDILFEIIADLFVEGSIDAANNKKISKWIRYPIIVLLSLFIIAVLGLIGYVGVAMIIKANSPLYILGGIIFLIFDVILIVSIIRKFKQ